MTNLLRVHVGLEGFVGGPGVNVLHFSAGLTEPSWTQGNVDWVFDELDELYDNMKSWFPDDVRIVLPDFADEIDSASGNIIGVQSPTATPAAITGTNVGGNASRGTALTVRYFTDVWTAGKRLRGRSYVGPVAPGVIADNGQVTADIITAVASAYTSITSGLGPRLAVYHRANPTTSSGGYYGDVVAVSCNPRPGNLRSRRD